MARTSRSALSGYLIAALATAGAVAVRAAIDPLLGTRTFTPILYVAVAVSIWFGGWAPAAWSAVVGYLTVHAIFIDPSGSFLPRTTDHWVNALIYVTSCAILIGFGEAVTSSERKLVIKQRELEALIAERRRVEELQRETEGRFRSLADQAPVLIWLNDLDGCEYVNREYLRFLGRPLEDVRGMGWSEFVHPDDMRDYVGAYEAAAERRQPFEAQFRFRSASGEYRWMKSSGLPRLTADGSLVGFVGCSLDITDVKEAIETLQESDRRKDEFLATLAHELRNPLAPLRNGLAILRLTSPDGGGQAERTLGVMERQLAHLVRLIDDLVDVSRISRGKVELRRQRLDLGAAVAEAAAIARPRIAAEGRELVVELPGQSVFVDGDATRLAQIVANLLDNAAKYTNRGGHVRLTVEGGREWVTIAVEDDGIGIPAEMLDRVFEMFTQVERQLEREQQGGLGIGLTLVKRLAELHGGTVEASSEGPGKGSRFTVRLPLAASESMVVDAAVAGRASTGTARNGRAAPVDDPDGGDGARPSGARRRVLVVDDNVDAAASQAAMLRLMGHEVESASDGFAGLEAAASFRPDLVLLDIGMPGLNGYDVCRRLRAQAWGADLTIVAVTGWGQEGDKRRALEAGFDRHLTKPMDPDALADLLERPPSTIAER